MHDPGEQFSSFPHPCPGLHPQVFIPQKNGLILIFWFGLITFGILSYFSIIRNFLQSLLPKSGTGPDEKVRKTGKFIYDLYFFITWTFKYNVV